MRTLITLTAAACLVGVALGQVPGQAPKPDPAYKAYEVWIGDWQYEGQAQDSPIGPGGKFSGKQTTRWVLNGFFIELRAHEKGNLGDLECVEFDWYDPAAKTYPYQGYLNNGDMYSAAGTVSGNVWRASGTWTHKGIQYKFRGETRIAADGMSCTLKSEISPDGKTWAPWAESKATKVTSLTAAADPSGVYTLISVNGKPVPTSLSDEGAVQVRSGTFTINADGTCTSKMTFVRGSASEATAVVRATYTKEGSKLTMQWTGAGTTVGTIDGSTFSMNNEGSMFAYRK